MSNISERLSRESRCAPSVGSTGWFGEVAYILRKRAKSAREHECDAVPVDIDDLLAVLERGERLDRGLRRIEAMYAGICLRNRDQYSDELLNEITATLSPPNGKADR